MMGEEHTQLRPVLTVVLCQEERCLERATAWAAACRREATGPIHVCTDLDLLLAYIAGARGGTPEDREEEQPAPPPSRPMKEWDADPKLDPRMASCGAAHAPKSD